MKKYLVVSFLLWLALGCGLPQETRRAVGNEGYLLIFATPNDAEVYVDGNLMGQARQFEGNPLELKSGSHKIEIRKPGYRPEFRDVFTGNQTRDMLKVDLRK